MSIIKTTYPDGRIEISTHSYILNRSKKHYPQKPYGYKKTFLFEDLMTTKNYIRLLKSAHKRLWRRDYAGYDFVFLTLTCKNPISLESLSDIFNNFLILFRKKHGPFEYVRAFEFNEKMGYIHIHVILQFCILSFFNEKPFINENYLKKIWKLGFFHVKYVEDIYGTLQYITTYKANNLLSDQRLTKFPRNTKIISTSQHFGVKISKSELVREEITKQGLSDLILKKPNNVFVRIDKHYFHNEFNHKQTCCIDKIFIHPKNNA